MTEEELDHIESELTLGKHLGLSKSMDFIVEARYLLEIRKALGVTTNYEALEKILLQIRGGI